MAQPLADILTNKDRSIRNFAKRILSYTEFGFEIGKLAKGTSIHAVVTRDYAYVVYPRYFVDTWKIEIQKGGKVVWDAFGNQETKDVFKALDELTWEFEGIEFHRFIYNYI